MNKSGARTAAGIMFILCALYYALTEAQYIIDYGFGYIDYWILPYFIGFVLAAVGMFADNLTLSAIGFGLCLIPAGRYVFLRVSDLFYGISYWQYIVYTAMAVTWFLSFVLMVIAGIIRKTGVGIAGGVMAVLYVIMDLFMVVYRAIDRGRIFSGSILNRILTGYGILFCLLLVIGAFLYAAAMHRKKEQPANYYGRPAYAGAGYGGQGYVPAQPAMQQPAMQQPTRQAAQQPVRQAAPQAQADVDQFEKLTQLKKLLDNGILTQEEFDMKKREILSRHL